MKVNTAVDHKKTLVHRLSEPPMRSQDKRVRRANQRIPKWAYLLFILLAGFVTYWVVQHRAAEAKATQPPVRPATVAGVMLKVFLLYLDEIVSCEAYQTVHVTA